MLADISGASSIAGPMKGPHALSLMSLYSTTVSISIRKDIEKMLEARTALVARVSTDLNFEERKLFEDQR